ncbi:MAG TPA: LysR family transcriptional regulator [Neobacillus sp.]|jgi:DNA-binding transcriptional LysR family regulator
MEWQQLEYFQSIARTENFHKSAALLSVSQPALSRAIQKLEDELGVTLFHRIGRTVKLNQYGQLFLKRVENSLNEINVGIQEVQHLKDPFSGVVSISFPQILGITILPKILDRFRHQYPNIKIQLFQENNFASIEKVKNREVDLCLINVTSEISNLSWKYLSDEEMFLYVSKNHKLSNVNSIELREVADEPFIGYKPHLSMRNVMLKMCKEAGFVPSITFEGDDILTIIGLISAGMGIGIIPYFTEVGNEYIHKVKITEPHCHREISIAWKDEKTLSPTAKLFKDYITELFV